MKRKFLLIPLCAVMGGLVLSSNSGGPYASSRENRTGIYGTSANCSGSGCHGANSAATSVTIFVTNAAGNPVTAYTPGMSYTVHVKGTNTSSAANSRFGFQSTAVLASDDRTQAGTFAASGNIAVRTSTPNIVEHSAKLSGTLSGTTGTYEATYTWTAPAARTGTVRFYATMNVVNGDNGTSGDAANTAPALDLTEASGTGVPAVSAAALQVYPNPAAGSLRLQLPEAVRQGSFQIRDVRGSIVSRGDLQIAQGQAALGLEALAAGAYFIHVQAAGTTMVAPFVKQ